MKPNYMMNATDVATELGISKGILKNTTLSNVEVIE